MGQISKYSEWKSRKINLLTLRNRKAFPSQWRWEEKKLKLESQASIVSVVEKGREPGGGGTHL